MRRRRPGSSWGDLWPPEDVDGDAAARPGGRLVAARTGEGLPAREPLHRVRSAAEIEPQIVPLPVAARGRAAIVGDLLDGALVYPEPPRRTRARAWLLRLTRRLSRPVWLFVLLAAIQAATMVADATARGLTILAAADLAVRLAYTASVTLLPAAVLIWRRDAWHSARAVLVGATMWTALPAAVAIAWWFVRHSPALLDAWGMPLAALLGGATAVAFFGPAAIAIGLDRLRGVATPMPTVGGIVGGGLLLFGNALRWLAPTASGPSYAATGALDPLNLPQSVSGAALPIELLCLLFLAYSCVRAVLADDVPADFWRCATFGTLVLVGLSFLRLAAGDPLGGAAVSGFAARGWDSALGAAVPLLGSGLVFAAFMAPIWSHAAEATSWRAAPEEVFAWGEAASGAGLVPAPLASIVSVAAGADHALALDDHGRVAGWGNDDLGQAEVPAGLSDVVAVAAGDGFSLALRSNGTVVGWGANDFGQTDVPAGLHGVTAIAAGRAFALALKTDGTVAGWGDADDALVPPRGLAGIVAISAGEHHCLALRFDGRVVAWGDNGAGQAYVPLGLSDVKAISAGGSFSLALCSDGTVVAWGDNRYGQLDVPASLKDVVAISAGAFHAVALTKDGDVVGWGGGGRRLGEGVHPWRLVDFKAIAAGDGFSLAVRAA